MFEEAHWEISKGEIKVIGNFFEQDRELKALFLAQI